VTPSAALTKERAPVVRGTATIVAAAFRAAPVRATAVFFLNIVQSASAAIIGLLIKLLVDAAVKQDGTAALTAAILIASTWAFTLTAAIAGFMLMVGLQERTALQIDKQIIDLTAGLEGIEHHERPEYVDQLQLLRDKRDQIAQALNAVVRNIAFIVQMTATIGLLVSMHPLLALLPLFGIPTLLGAGRMSTILIAADESVSEQRRLANHLFDLATASAPGKELRIFGLRAEIRRRHDAVLRSNDRVLTKARARGTAWFAAGWFVFAVGFVLAVLFVANRAVHGLATLGDVVLAMTLASSLNEHVSQGVGMMTWLVETMKTVSRYLWLTSYAREHRSVVLDQMPVPDRLSRGIDFEDVTFRYPGTETVVLRDVNLHIPAGATVAIVGDNGAGKSTLVKLLCRFYRPSDGKIKLDDTDLARFEMEDWRAHLSAGFQDFAHFEFEARETVGVGALGEIANDAAITNALGRANATDVIGALPRGLDTQLGKSFDDGVELSGGQWQKLALGRAMMRPHPLLLVLDEPTAALDAQTEHALFERYAHAAREAARASGAITVLVSHRFSTVRMADVIVVIDGGAVAEYGSHAELVAKNGLYAELYELQARAYR